MGTILAILQGISAFSMLILVGVTTFYAVQTLKMVREMEATRKAQMMPNIEAKLVQLRDRSPFDSVLRIANVGLGPGKNVSIKFWTEPAGGSDREWKPLVLFSGDRQDFKIPVGPARDNTETNMDKLAANYNYVQIRATYEDIFGRSYKNSQTIDIKGYVGVLQSVGQLVPVDEIYNIRTTLEDINDTLENLGKKKLNQLKKETQD
jgi:hypothetical protein